MFVSSVEFSSLSESDQLCIMQEIHSNRRNALGPNPIFITHSQVNMPMHDIIEGKGKINGLTMEFVRSKTDTAKAMEIVESAMSLQSQLYELNQVNNAYFEFPVLFLIILCLFAMIGIGYNSLAAAFDDSLSKCYCRSYVSQCTKTMCEYFFVKQLGMNFMEYSSPWHIRL